MYKYKKRYFRTLLEGVKRVGNVKGVMRNTKGEIYVLVCVWVLIIVTVFSVVFTYASVITVIKVQKANSEVVFDGFTAKNSIVIFNNIKQGKNATTGVDVSEYQSHLKEFCTLDESGGMLYSKDAAGNEKYSMTVPTVGYTEEGKLELYASYTMYIPIRFAGATVTTATVPVKITSALNSKN